MKHAICPNCDADVELPASFAGGDAWCPNCNQGFFVDPPEAAPADAPRTVPPPRRGTPRARPSFPAQAASSSVLKESVRLVLMWFFITVIASVVLFLVYGFTGWRLFFWLGILACSAFECALMLFGFAYLRTLAINSERR